MTNGNELVKDKLLLLLLPFWTPMIPPLGISTLKSYLKKNDVNVKAVDVNIKESFRKIYDEYFDVLEMHVPKNQKGNLRNIGLIVFHEHLMISLHSKKNDDNYIIYNETISKIFFCKFSNEGLDKIKEICARFYDLLEEYLHQLIIEEKPSVVGLSVYGDTFPASLFALKLIKENYHHIKTFMGGGIFAEPLALESTNFDYFSKRYGKYIDHIIIGEGEGLVLKLMKNQLPSDQKVFTIKDQGNDKIEIDKLYEPDFSDFDLDYYTYLASFTSRSCPYQCNFCSEPLQWGKYRKKSGAKISEELISMASKFNRQLFLFGDSLLNPVIDDLSKEIIKTKASVYWDGYLRANKHVTDPENTFLWRKAGFYRARLGIESGSQRVLELMGKKTNIKQIKEAIINLALAGIKTTTYWVIGYPGETEEDFQKTLDLIEELKDEIYEADCNPFKYFKKIQVNSNEWAQCEVPIYPENYREYMILQSWELNMYPLREEIFKRIWRFVDHCKKLGIPNPYSLNEIYKADMRWKKLHKNAVPSIVEFEKQDKILTENYDIKRVNYAVDSVVIDEDYSF